MIIPDRKKAASVIVSRMDPSSSSPEAAEGDSDPASAIAEDILDAVKSGSASGLADALKAFFAHCDMEPDESYEE